MKKTWGSHFDFIRKFFTENYLFLFSFFAIFLLFQQDDLYFTSRVSLNLYGFEPLKLYENAAKYMGSGQINYMPSTYFVFALWGLPLKLLGINLSPAESIGFAVYWYKLLPVAVYFACAALLKSLIQQIVDDVKIAEKVAILWLVSPLAFFSQFTFGQYDSFTLFCMLLGFHYYFKKDLARFTWCFGIAITFKYFAAFVFFPLLLLLEKDLKRLAKYSFLFLVPFVVEVAPFALTGSKEFNAGVFGFSAANRVFGILVSNGLSTFNLVFMIWGVLCGYLYFWEGAVGAWKERALTWVSVSLIPVFFFVYWHPQWLLLLSPFMMLNLMYKRSLKTYLNFQMILMAVAMVLFVLNWPGNVDQTLLKLGVLGKWGPDLWDGMIGMRAFFLIRNGGIWLSFFNSLLVISLIFTLRNTFKENEKVELADFNASKALVRTYSIASIWMFPGFALLAYFLTLIRNFKAG